NLNPHRKVYSGGRRQRERRSRQHASKSPELIVGGRGSACGFQERPGV
ncbi:unnamed protein product, partial [Urochloa humidicola]